MGAAAPAHAISHAAATRIALRALAPQREAGPVLVFSLPRPLPRGSSVYEAGPPPLPGIRALAAPTYLYWEDLAHGAFFAHASRLLLVDARSGRVLRSEDMSWFLIINNRLAPFLISAQGYQGRTYVVYEASPKRARHARVARRTAHAHASRYAGNGKPTPRTAVLAHDCFIPIGDFSSPLFVGGGRAMRTFAVRIGLKVIEPEVPTPKSLGKAVEEATAEGCNDVFIYLAGHGVPPDAGAFAAGAPQVWHNLAQPVTVGGANPGGPAGVITHPAFLNRGGRVVDESDYIRPSDLVAIAKAHESAEFKIKIDSCFADRFAPVFEETDNVRVLETSSSFDEVSAGSYVLHKSYFTLDPATHKVNGSKVNEIDNPDGAGGFTNGNVHGLYDWALSSSPSEGLAEGLVTAFGLGMPFNESVALGYTTPHLRSRPARMSQTIGAAGAWSFLSPAELRLYFSFVIETAAAKPLAFAAAAGAPLDAVKVVVPPAGSTPRQIVNSLCPAQLPVGAVSSTANPNDTLTCSGGSLPIGQSATLDVQTVPAPTAGVGGQLYGSRGGALIGPFAITGP
jgi:hypothetical protein